MRRAGDVTDTLMYSLDTELGRQYARFREAPSRGASPPILQKCRPCLSDNRPCISKSIPWMAKSKACFLRKQRHLDDSRCLRALERSVFRVNIFQKNSVLTNGAQLKSPFVKSAWIAGIVVPVEGCRCRKLIEKCFVRSYMRPVKVIDTRPLLIKKA